MADKPLYINDALLEMLHKLPVFSVFSYDELRRMLYSGKFLRIDKFAPGDVVIQEGTYGRWVYVLIKGAVKVVKAGAEICRLNNQGEVLGEIGAVQSRVRSATVIATEVSVFLSLDISVIEHMSGEEKYEYLQRMKGFLGPLIQERLPRTLEIATLMADIRAKRAELGQLEERLRKLGVTEEKTVLQALLEGGG